MIDMREKGKSKDQAQKADNDPQVLNKETIVEALEALGVAEDGARRGYTVAVTKDEVMIYKGEDLSLIDKFAGKNMDAKAYAGWIMATINTQLFSR